MKKLFLLAAMALLCLAGHSQNTMKLKDGFYEVAAFIKDSAGAKDAGKGKRVISFNRNFKEDAPKDCQGLVIYTNEFVPLDLKAVPTLTDKPGLKNRLNVSLKPSAAASLKTFTEKRVMKQVAIVMDGEALTVHKVRVAITSGNFEISRCSDTGCEKLLVMMKERVAK